MISVEKALALILENSISLRKISVPFEDALGRILAEDLFADRDFPPYDRVTMDGIAIDFQVFENGQRTFKIQEMQGAGDLQSTLHTSQNCIEIMTGGVLPKNTSAVVRYEDLKIVDGFATINSEIQKGQNVHHQGQDKKAGELVLQRGTKLDASHLALAATIGKQTLDVFELPNVAIVSSGDELVEITEIPLPHQIRKSNVYAVGALLKKLNVSVSYFHIADDLENSILKIAELLKNFEVLIFSGGVSMGKKDFIPEALKANNVETIFHKIAQKPGKPMWFGKTAKNMVFALPGNPVSTYLCTILYVLPFLEKCLGSLKKDFEKVILGEDIQFKPQLSYFLQVKIENVAGTLMAFPLKHNGSGDFISLSDADGFVELPNSEDILFKKGQIVNFFAI
ncbi:molybdopterin molybdotransferase MoeA [Lacihabitans soyangensis]|uniref:Molybdopterin molybdenumtransferase n=1 Tax=Lacihabitans soyangensis TaxID=869394 RepID=A0AAE3KRR7_9BACT|nr:molybdopterin molybdotransferase MoeA [Lacihabitans soyangensis]MCP9761769.1 molybdopterin molybdenumtransferase MoeA [Lacihabitans soyangensis]